MTRRHLTTLVLALCLPLMIHCTGDKDTDTDTDTDTDRGDTDTDTDTDVESDPISEAFTDPESYRDTFFVTPNGNCVLSSPMLRSMLGAGEEIFGGGEFAKVGCSTGMFYARMTDGIDNDYQFHVLRAPENRTNTLPPDVTSLGDLPELITDNLPGYASVSKVPLFLSDLEWARYNDLPLSIQIQTIGSHGGNISDALYDLNVYIESMGKEHCMWDVSDVCDPTDDCGTTWAENLADGNQSGSDLTPAGASWGDFTYATPTMVDPEIAAQLGYDLPFQGYVKRNLQDGVHQILEIMSLERYQGMLVAFAFDPEVHYPSHDNGELLLADGSASRAMIEDYHPAMIHAFGLWLQDLYGDQSPTVDSNGDGHTFWDDHQVEYENSGGFGHGHSLPATWAEIDPPRFEASQPDDPYWQLWTKFRISVIDDWMENTVDWLQEAGVPGDRIFTHQTTAPLFNTDRTNGTGRQWLDDWSHLEIDGGFMGISKYQPHHVGEGRYLYQNLARRDDGWGAPEYNPYVKQPGVLYASASEVENDVRTAWDTGAHVLWMHSWGSPSHPAVQFNAPGASWGGDQLTHGPQSWSASGFDNTQVNNHASATSGSAYFESPVLGLNASRYPFLAAKMHHVLDDPAVTESWKVAFTTADDQVWNEEKEVSLASVRHAPHGHKEYVIHVASNPAWTGVIDQLRIYPVSSAGSSVWIKEAYLVSPNVFTSEMSKLIQDKKDTPRPAMAEAMAIELPFEMVSNMESLGDNFVVYGSENDGDFGTVANFWSSEAVCGGVTRTAINAPVDPLRLSMTKTGKWRKLEVPENAALSFYVGIADGSESTDGVHFRIRIRDQAREWHTPFSKVHRENQWSERIEISLLEFGGQTVDLLLETHGISETTGDDALWGEPTISSADE